LQGGQVPQGQRKCLFEDSASTRAGNMELGKLTGPVGQLDLLRNEVTIQVPNNLFAGCRAAIDQEDRIPVRQGSAVNENENDRLGLGRGQECLAALARSQPFDVVGAEIVQKGGRIWASDLYLAVERAIKKGRCVAGGLVAGSISGHTRSVHHDLIPARSASDGRPSLALRAGM
jgi:hypothetical protein